MTLRRLAALQWLGLLFGAGTWALGFIAGFGLTQAECGAGGARWGIANDLWQAIVMSVTVALRARRRGRRRDSAPADARGELRRRRAAPRADPLLRDRGDRRECRSS